MTRCFSGCSVWMKSFRSHSAFGAVSTDLGAWSMLEQNCFCSSASSKRLSAGSLANGWDQTMSEVGALNTTVGRAHLRCLKLDRKARYLPHKA